MEEKKKQAFAFAVNRLNNLHKSGGTSLAVCGIEKTKFDVLFC